MNALANLGIFESDRVGLSWMKAQALTRACAALAGTLSWALLAWTFNRLAGRRAAS